MRVIESNIQPLHVTYKNSSWGYFKMSVINWDIVMCIFTNSLIEHSGRIENMLQIWFRCVQHLHDCVRVCITRGRVHHQRARALDAWGLLMNHYNNTDGSVCSNDTWMCFLNAELVLRANHMHLCSSRRPRASARDGKTRKLCPTRNALYKVRCTQSLI